MNGRKTVISVLSKFITCKQFNSKNLEYLPISLPENRVRDAAVFQIFGIDLADPLFLKDNQKRWVALFSCAIYQEAQFNLATSSSTKAFLVALRRFVSRRGRCYFICCDSGPKFVRAANYLIRLIRNRIQEDGLIDSI